MTTADEPVRRRSRSLLPRFGLRSLFVVALLFCLAFAWLGKNAYRVRQEEAAIEALMQAGSAIVLENDEERELHPATPPRGTESTQSTWQELVGRTTGWSQRRPIREIVLHGEDAGDPKIARALAALAWFPEIRAIDLSGVAFDDRAILHLAKLPRLETLTMSESTMTGAGLASLAAHVKLQELSISRETPSAHLLGGVPAFSELSKLHVEGLPISRADVTAIASLPKLESLRLDLLQPAPGEEVFAPLANAPSLRYFHESRSGMTEADMPTLAKLSALETLWLSCATAEGLSRLGSLPNLKQIYVYGPATEEEVRAFSAAHPDVEVAYGLFTSHGRWFRAGKSE